MADVSRPWMQAHDPQTLQNAIEYALALIFKDQGPMPQPDVETAEQALSLVAGMYTAATIEYPARPQSLRKLLIEKRDWMRAHPGEWPVVLSIPRSDQN